MFPYSSGQASETVPSLFFCLNIIYSLPFALAVKVCEPSAFRPILHSTTPTYAHEFGALFAADRKSAFTAAKSAAIPNSANNLISCYVSIIIRYDMILLMSISLVTPPGFEPGTLGLEDRCSNPLS